MQGMAREGKEGDGRRGKEMRGEESRGEERGKEGIKGLKRERKGRRHLGKRGRESFCSNMEKKRVHHHSNREGSYSMAVRN